MWISIIRQAILGSCDNRANPRCSLTIYYSELWRQPKFARSVANQWPQLTQLSPTVAGGLGGGVFPLPLLSGHYQHR